LYGEVGVLTYDEIEDKVQCHICGKWFRGLSAHVWQTHGWSADDYREEFGLNRGQSLVCEGTRQRLRELNKQLGNWKHLSSQIMTKAELLEFLRSNRLGRGIRLRPQACLLKSKLLTEYNPMNEPEAQERALANLRDSWYGTPSMRDLCRHNLLATIQRRREKTLLSGKWRCPCGEVFPVRKDGEHHRRNCPVARAVKISAQVKARKTWWDNLPEEERELHRKHVSESKKRQYTQRSEGEH